jgi:hypothetical protein
MTLVRWSLRQFDSIELPLLTLTNLTISCTRWNDCHEGVRSVVSGSRGSVQLSPG